MAAPTLPGPSKAHSTTKVALRGPNLCLVTPHTSLLAIPESELNSATRPTLSAARQAKRNLLANNADALALRSGGDGQALSPQMPADFRGLLLAALWYRRRR